MRIARVFFDVHMAKNFNGLLSICHKAGIKPEAEGESYIVFVNGAHTKFKLLVGNQYIVYHDNRTRRFPLDAIRYLPDAFNGKSFVFEKAIEKSLQEKLNR